MGFDFITFTSAKLLLDDLIERGLLPKAFANTLCLQGAVVDTLRLLIS